MDHKLTNPETDSWVDDRLASLAPAPEWTPNTQRVWNQVVSGQKAPGPSLGPRWMSIGMTATILATTVVVLALLPWQRLWSPEAAKGPLTAGETQGETQKTAPQAPLPPAEQTEAAKASEDRQQPPLELERHLIPANPEEFLFEREEKTSLSKEARTQPEQVESAKLMRAEASTAGAAQSSGLTQPTIVSRVLPEYTEEAKQAKILGTVELIVTIRTDGSVQVERVKSGLGFGLDEKAREAVEKWQFTPGMKDGVPVPTMIGVNVTFSLR
jgi:TonB family protein